MISESNAIDARYPQFSKVLDEDEHQNDIFRLENQIQQLLERVTALEEQLEQKVHDSPPVDSVAHQLIASIELQATEDAQSGISGMRDVPLLVEEASETNEPAFEDDGLDNLKRQLREQLRNAELEMSLERARVFQQRAELEELKIQLAHDRTNDVESEPRNPESRLDRLVGYLKR